MFNPLLISLGCLILFVFAAAIQPHTVRRGWSVGLLYLVVFIALFLVGLQLAALLVLVGSVTAEAVLRLRGARKPVGIGERIALFGGALLASAIVLTQFGLSTPIPLPDSVSVGPLIITLLIGWGVILVIDWLIVRTLPTTSSLLIEFSLVVLTGVVLLSVHSDLILMLIFTLLAVTTFFAAQQERTRNQLNQRQKEIDLLTSVSQFTAATPQPG